MFGASVGAGRDDVMMKMETSSEGDKREVIYVTQYCISTNS